MPTPLPPADVERMIRAAAAMVLERVVAWRSPTGASGAVFIQDLEETLAEGEYEPAWICLMNMGERVGAPPKYWMAVAEVARVLGDEKGRQEAMGKVSPRGT